MTRYDFVTSIEEIIPMFFPELKKRKIIDCVFIDFNSNKLIFSITFHMDNFSPSDFNGKLNNFKLLLKELGVISIENLIKPEIDSDELNFQKHYFLVPTTMAQGFVD